MCVCLFVMQACACVRACLFVGQACVGNRLDLDQFGCMPVMCVKHARILVRACV
jgi:hypothetical protein